MREIAETINNNESDIFQLRMQIQEKKDELANQKPKIKNLNEWMSIASALASDKSDIVPRITEGLETMKKLRDSNCEFKKEILAEERKNRQIKEHLVNQMKATQEQELVLQSTHKGKLLLHMHNLQNSIQTLTSEVEILSQKNLEYREEEQTDNLPELYNQAGANYEKLRIEHVKLITSLSKEEKGRFERERNKSGVLSKINCMPNVKADIDTEFLVEDDFAQDVNFLKIEKRTSLWKLDSTDNKH